MTRLRSLIEETGIMVLAVVHLKRTGGGSGKDGGKSYNEGKTVSLTDLRGSGSLEQISDVVIALERDQQHEQYPNLSTIRVLKNRPIGTTGKAGLAEYNKVTGRLVPANDPEQAEGFGFANEEETATPVAENAGEQRKEF